MNKKQKIELYKIIASAVFFVLGVIISVFLKKAEIIKAVMFFISYIIVGYKIIFKAVSNIFKGNLFDENFLMTIASIGAFVLGEYAEGAGVMLFFSIGELFQSCAVESSRKSIAELMDIRPDIVNIIKDGEIIEKDAQDILIGEEIIIKPGERVALDGVVLEGQSLIDLSALTGESIPAEKNVGDEILSGSINLNGLLKIRVTREYFDTTVSKILELVENSAQNKSKSENFITKFSKVYTPIVVILALALAFLPPLIFLQPLGPWVYRALTFLVISCPCALVISVPLSFFGAVGRASKLGILVKGGSFLEALSKADTMVFDKTGTLTNGKFSVTEIIPQNISKDELLYLAAQVESASEHPISKSILKAYNKKVDASKVTDIKEIAGKGIRANVSGKEIYVGNYSLICDLGLDVAQNNSGKTAVYVASQNEYLGVIIISDAIKEEAKEALFRIKTLGIKNTVMLTGDKKEIADEVKNKLSIDKVYSQLLPQDKVSKLNEIIKNKKRGSVVYVGDGINDAPALSLCDVGVAMGALGADSAIEAADVVIMNDNLLKLCDTLKISKKTVKIARQNIIFAIGVKVLILVLGAIGLANMWQAVFADVGVAVIAILNAMRTLYKGEK